MKKVLSVLMAVLMLSALFAVAVSAEDNPSPEPQHYYTIEVTVEGNGTANGDPTTGEEGETSKLVAKPDDGSKFIGWEITGEYEIVEGTLNSEVIVIRAKGTVKAVAKFQPTDTKKDDGPVSPTTGYTTQIVVAAMAVVLTISAAAVVVLGKRYFSAK